MPARPENNVRVKRKYLEQQVHSFSLIFSISFYRLDGYKFIVHHKDNLNLLLSYNCKYGKKKKFSEQLHLC